MPRVIIVVVAAALVFACSNGEDASSAPSTFTPGESVSDTTPPPIVAEPPKGACADEGEEQWVRTGGSEGCRFVEAGAYVPSTPTTWHCTCTTGQFSCEITHGGYGMSVCP